MPSNFNSGRPLLKKYAVQRRNKSDTKTVKEEKAKEKK